MLHQILWQFIIYQNQTEFQLIRVETRSSVRVVISQRKMVRLDSVSEDAGILVPQTRLLVMQEEDEVRDECYVRRSQEAKFTAGRILQV